MGLSSLNMCRQLLGNHQHSPHKPIISSLTQQGQYILLYLGCLNLNCCFCWSAPCAIIGYPLLLIHSSAVSPSSEKSILTLLQIRPLWMLCCLQVIWEISFQRTGLLRDLPYAWHTSMTIKYTEKRVIAISERWNRHTSIFHKFSPSCVTEILPHMWQTA